MELRPRRHQEPDVDSVSEAEYPRVGTHSDSKYVDTAPETGPIISSHGYLSLVPKEAARRVFYNITNRRRARLRKSNGSCDDTLELLFQEDAQLLRSAQVYCEELQQTASEGLLWDDAPERSEPLEREFLKLRPGVYQKSSPRKRKLRMQSQRNYGSIESPVERHQYLNFSPREALTKVLQNVSARRRTYRRSGAQWLAGQEESLSLLGKHYRVSLLATPSKGLSWDDAPERPRKLEREFQKMRRKKHVARYKDTQNTTSILPSPTSSGFIDDPSSDEPVAPMSPNGRQTFEEWVAPIAHELNAVDGQQVTTYANLIVTNWNQKMDIQKQGIQIIYSLLEDKNLAVADLSDLIEAVDDSMSSTEKLVMKLASRLPPTPHTQDREIIG